jgi:hypothetical protein
MRARKVAFMLAISALSALTMFVITLPSCADPAAAAELPPRAAVPDTLASYQETVIAGPEGDARVEIVAVIGRGEFQDLLVPFDFDDGADFSITSGPARFRRDSGGLIAPTVMMLGHRMLNLECTDAVAGDTVRVTAALPGWFAGAAKERPFGEHRVDRRFVNTSDHVMADLRVGLVLPQGMVVHSVEKVVPSYDPKKNPEPPFSVAKDGDRVVVSLARGMVNPAAAVELGVNIRPARRGPLILIVGLVLAALYLMFFRDVLKPQEA